MIYALELKKMKNVKLITLFLLFSLLSIYFVQAGIDNYKQAAANKDKFQDIERMKVNQYFTYAQYGAYGFRLLFIPSPLSIFFTNSSVISELTSNVDAGEKLNIYNSFKGRTLFAEKSGGFKDFSGLVLLLGSLLVLYFGYDLMIYKDYLRFMAGVVSPGKLFAAITLSRVSIFILYFFLNTGISILLLRLSGVELSPHEWGRFLIYLGALSLLLIFFFFLGTVAGSFRSRFAGFVVLAASWFALVFLVPGVVGAVTSRKADNITSNYHMELEKLQAMMGFEKRAIAQKGYLSEINKESERELVENYWRNEFKAIQALEKKMEREMKENILHFQTLSSLFPSTFYLSTANEISSKGYVSFIRFFEYVQRLKKRFVRFYLDKRYYSDMSKQQPRNVASFITADENLFYADSALPPFFFPGVMMLVIYIGGLVALSYWRFRRSLKL